MALERNSLSEKLDKVQKSIQQFPAVAASLSTATDQLGKAIGQLDTILKRFSLGVPTWVTFTRLLNDDAGCRYYEEIGYVKISGRWGISLRTLTQEVGQADDIEQWPFNDAPRLLRVHAVDWIPELLDALLNNASEMSKRIAEKATEVDALASGIHSVIGSQNSLARLAAGGSVISQVSKQFEPPDESFSARLAKNLLSVPTENLAGATKVTSSVRNRK